MESCLPDCLLVYGEFTVALHQTTIHDYETRVGLLSRDHGDTKPNLQSGNATKPGSPPGIAREHFSYDNG